jgi:ArsR family transcriptional regulator
MIIIFEKYRNLETRNMDKKALLAVLKAAANDSRLTILMMLSDPDKYFPDAKSDPQTQGICMGLIAKKLGFSPSTVSSYLSKLESVGLVKSQRQGQWTFYRLCPATITEVTQALKRLISGKLL